MNNGLAGKLKTALSDTFQMYFKAHSYHWNVTGMFFPYLHPFFGDLYNELWTAIDPLAEHVRTLDEYAPRGLDRIVEFTTIPFDDGIPETTQMITNLLDANHMVLRSLKEAHEQANFEEKTGIVNFLEERIDVHEKHGWMLRSTLERATP